MKILLTHLLCLFSLGLLAQQPTGDIERDTALANQLYLEAMELEHSDTNIVTLMEQAIALYEHHQMVNKTILAKGDLAIFYSKTRDEKGIALAEEAIAEAIKKYNDDMHVSLKKAYEALYFSYTRFNYEKGAKYGQKYLTFFKTTSDEYFKVIANIIFDLIISVNVPEATKWIDEFEEALNQPDNATFLPHQVSLYRAKMKFYDLIHEYEKALIFGEKAFLEDEKYQFLPIELKIPMYSEMAYGYAGIGRLKEALIYMEEGVSLAEKHLSKNEIGSYYMSYADILRKAGRKETAIDNYKKSIEFMIADDIGAGQSHLAAAYFNLAVLYLELGDDDNAEDQLKKAYELDYNFNFDLVYSAILTNKEKFEEGLGYAQKVIIDLSSQFESKKIEDNPTQFETYVNDYWGAYALWVKAVGLEKQGKAENSIEAYELAFSTMEMVIKVNTRANATMKGYDDSKLFFNKYTAIYLRNLMRIAYHIYEIRQSQEDIERMFNISERLKAILLIETLNPVDLPVEFQLKEKEILNQIKSLQQQKELARKDSISYFNEELFATNAQLEQLIQEISKKHPQIANNFYNIKYIDLKEIQANLQEEELFIEYSVYPKGSFYAIAITKDNSVLISFPENTLNDNFTEIKKLLRNPLLVQKKNREHFIDVSNDLYKQLLAPFAEQLKNKTKITIIPSGGLFHLPFEVLLPTNEKKPFHELDYLVKNYEINYHYSGTAFQQLQAKPTIKDGSLLAFAPVFDDGTAFSESTRALEFLVDSLYRGMENNRFVPLPNSKKEVKSIAKTLGNKGKTTILLEEKATKSNLSAQIAQQPYQFVHIATHGFVNYQNPKLSGLACYQTDDTTPGSGLYFANEIQMQDIQADLVVLSSCESGIGQLVAGEGLIALNRSFIYSGAKNVLFSLWKVDDRYSSDLMIDFYKEYTTGISYTAALRNAKLKMLANPDTAQPRFWAPFVLMGE